jgi:hypothetical protein
MVPARTSRLRAKRFKSTLLLDRWELRSRNGSRSHLIAAIVWEQRDRAPVCCVRGWLPGRPSLQLQVKSYTLRRTLDRRTTLSVNPSGSASQRARVGGSHGWPALTVGKFRNPRGLPESIRRSERSADLRYMPQIFTAPHQGCQIWPELQSDPAQVWNEPRDFI